MKQRGLVIRGVACALAGFAALGDWDRVHAAPPPPVVVCDGTTEWRAAPPDGTPPELRTLDAWLARIPDLDEPLLSPDDIALLVARNQGLPGAWREFLGDDPPTPERVAADLGERLMEVGARLAAGELVEGEPGRFEEARRVVASAEPVDELRAVVQPIDLQCLPVVGGYFRPPIDRLFGRNQCSRLHPGELVRVLRATRDGRWRYVWAGHGVGWLADSDQAGALSRPMPPRVARDRRDEEPRLRVLGDLVPAWTADGQLLFLRLGTSFRAVGMLTLSTSGNAHPERLWQILVPSAATPGGTTDAFTADSADVHFGPLPLTRRTVLSLAFARLGDPYGWGGTLGFRDCSGLLQDVMATFDYWLGRHSSVQAESGAVVLDVTGRGDDDKRQTIAAAARRGIVFLYMPGHIMLYLGEDGGRPYALSAISEYVVPCPDGGKKTIRLDRIEVTDLERGRGTERTAFIERIAKVAIFGR
jgi:hypothetical protein